MIIYWGFLHEVILNFSCPFEIAGNVREVEEIKALIFMWTRYCPAPPPKLEAPLEEYFEAIYALHSLYN